MSVKKENTIIRYQNSTINQENGNVYQNYTLDQEFMDIEVMCQTFLEKLIYLSIYIVGIPYTAKYWKKKKAI
jgi:hypothetical protein